MRPVLTFFPETKLAKLAARPGGIMRDIAVENATQMIESMRGEGDAAIIAGMEEIEKIMASVQNKRIPAEQIKAVLCQADQTVTLAETFGYKPFARCMKSLCDVADGLLTAGLEDVAPIAVHASSMRLLAPGTASLSPQQADIVLAELAKILTHYDFKPIGNPSEKA